MLVGLQGSGKTTTSGKLANLLRKQGKNPLLVACDVYRPAAIKQLQVVGKQLNIPVFANETSKDVVHIAKQAMSTAISKLNDVVILDTAGRLHIDEALMDELKNLKAGIKPHEILLVVDSMTGQDAVNVAEKFNEALGIDGVVLTKLDGDTRGGAALSVKKVTGKPIKFAATGEKLSDIEVFHPDRMAQRILGMGDILSVIEKAEESFDLEQAEKLEKQLRKKEFDLDDYLSQIRQIKKMGSFSSLLKMIPGMNQLKDVKIDDKEFVKIEAMICSMTKAEKRNTKLDWAMSRNYQFIPYKEMSEYQKAMVRQVLEARRLYQRTGTPLYIHERSVSILRKMKNETKQCGVYVKRRETRRVQKELIKTVQQRRKKQL